MGGDAGHHLPCAKDAGVGPKAYGMMSPRWLIQRVERAALDVLAKHRGRTTDPSS